MKNNMTKKVKGLRMPGAFTILFLLTIISVFATWVIPSGSYDKLQYNDTSKSLLLIKPTGDTFKLKARQEELDKLGIKINISQFTSGAINKPISVPNTYKKLKQHPASISDITTSMVNGTVEATDIMVFIMILGGMIGVVRLSGAFESGLIALTKKTKGHEFLLIFLVSILMLIGGTLCGIEEEAVAFYPILVPVFLAMGYDSIICVGSIFLASSIGTAFSTINPFSSVIASNAAGISFTEGLLWRTIGCVFGGLFVICYLYWYSKKIKIDPSYSYSYEDKDKFEKKWLISQNNDIEFTIKQQLILFLFVLAFPIMVWGVMTQGWWFPKMASSFLGITIIIIILVIFGNNGIGEKKVIDEFINGASSLVGVSLIIGLARGINIILNEGYISDTILYSASKVISHVSGPFFIIIMMFTFFILGLIVPSSSGLAVLSMPILAPLADTVDINRSSVVMAYQFGQYAMLFLAPTGLVMATLQMLDMRYSHWIRFVYPVVIFLLGFGGFILVLQVII